MRYIFLLKWGHTLTDNVMKKKYAKPQEPETNEYFPGTNDDKSRNIFFYWGVLKSINS